MIREFIVRIDDTLKGAQDDMDELYRKWGADEVPPHGRLIDADEYKHNLKWNENIDNAPTVVEANKSR